MKIETPEKKAAYRRGVRDCADSVMAWINTHEEKIIAKKHVYAYAMTISPDYLMEKRNEL